MKKYKSFYVAITLTIGLSVTSCIEETIPTDIATQDQIESSSKAIESILWSMPGYINKYDLMEEDLAYDWGYGSLMHIRDVMTEEMVVVSSNYDWYDSWESNQYMGADWMSTGFVWRYYFRFIQTSNKMLSAIDESTASETELEYQGIALAFRALAYLDIAQMYEFLPNDTTSSINDDGNNVLNLTVPIVKETMVESDVRNNPRATRDSMFAFILSDLDKAEDRLIDAKRLSKTLPDISVVYGLKARLYMWVANYPKAEEYARKAIDLNIYTPTTKDEWLNTTTGFNNIDCSSWMLGAQTKKEDKVVQSGILNWTSWMSNEAQYGYAAAGPMTCVASGFYAKIDNQDFRKLSWKAPEGSILFGKESYIDEKFGSKMVDYASIKFRPGNGNIEDYQIGSACSYPMMRIEEMYFIEAEAAAHQNAERGKQLLTNFMTQYRYKTYKCDFSSTEDIVDEIFLQKRIELWGEGLSFFDYKRLNKPVVRKYDGTNFSDATQFTTTTRPAWMNFVISRREVSNNTALKGWNNPDPSNKYDK